MATFRERALHILDESQGPRDFKYREMVKLFDEVEQALLDSSNRVDELQAEGTKLIQQTRAMRARLTAAKHVIEALTMQLPFAFSVMRDMGLRDVAHAFEEEKNRIVTLWRRNDQLERALGAQGMGLFAQVCEFIDDPFWKDTTNVGLGSFIEHINLWRRRFAHYRNG